MLRFKLLFSGIAFLSSAFPRLQLHANSGCGWHDRCPHDPLRARPKLNMRQGVNTRLEQHENNRARLRRGVEHFQRVNLKRLTKITKPNKWRPRPIKSLADFSYPLLTRLLTPLTTRRVASVLKLRHGASSGGPGAIRVHKDAGASSSSRAAHPLPDMPSLLLAHR